LLPRSGGYAALIRVLLVTTGGMLQRHAANRQIGSGLMSDPGYGDLNLKKEYDLKRVFGMCFVAPGNDYSFFLLFRFFNL
jgi:hypothetical protein